MRFLQWGEKLRLTWQILPYEYLKNDPRIASRLHAK